MDFKKELEELINRHSLENDSSTPDWILARFLDQCLYSFNTAVQQRDAVEYRDTGPSETKGE